MAHPPNPGDEEGLGSTARALRTSQPYLSAVWQLVGGGVVGVGGGYFLDKGLGTEPWGMVALSVVGISVGFYAFIRTMLRLGKK